MEITSRPEDADVLVVNTCAFIDSAKEESIEAILEAHQQRGLDRRPDQKLIVSGCMSQRFAKELRHELPEVDAFIGLDQVSEFGKIVEKLLRKRPAPNAETSNVDSGNGDLGLAFADTRPTYIPDYDTPRFRLTPVHFAYVKIAEGCNHPCSFCVIPQMRGKHRSRPLHSVLAEIRGLVREGVREINLISQDTTYYGMDLWPAKAGPRQPIDSTRGPTLAVLLREIQAIEGEFWVRLLYTHPAHWSDELIETIAQCDKVARYIDIPLQHIDDAMLGRMRRETSRAHIENLIHKLRSGIPGVTLRTTFIVGFPGETDAEFASLLDFIRRTRFERLGIFKYSQEEGSRAGKMPGHIPAKIKNARYRAAMLVQQQIAHEVAREKVGRELKLLVDQPHIARSEGDAPDVDARVVLSEAAPVGEFISRKTTGSRGYDLLA
jgi:ribosomal protein S12 methylthiotransferase